MSRIFRFTEWILSDADRVAEGKRLCKLAGSKDAAVPFFRLFLTQYAYEMRVYGVADTRQNVRYIIDAVYDLDQ